MLTVAVRTNRLTLVFAVPIPVVLIFRRVQQSRRCVAVGEWRTVGVNAPREFRSNRNTFSAREHNLRVVRSDLVVERQSLRNHLVHVVVFVGREASTEVDVRGFLSEGSIFFV